MYLITIGFVGNFKAQVEVEARTNHIFRVLLGQGIILERIFQNIYAFLLGC
jgi:hypothetical protein